MIRKAKIEDLIEIAGIIEEVKKQMTEGGNPQWNSGYPSKKEYLEDIRKGELYLEETEEGISGFVTVNPNLYREYENVEWNTPLPANGIHRLAVNPLSRSKGVASRLLIFAEKISKGQGYKSIRLDTFSLNHAAQQLFRKNGYRFVGEIFMKGKTIPYFCFEKSLVLEQT